MLSGEPPRLYVVTRAPRRVLADDPVNLDQAGLRGLLRVIGAEYPQLRATQIDVDSDIDTEQLVSELLAGSDDDETAWRGGHRYAARLRPSPLRADERRIATFDNEIDGMRLEVRSPATWRRSNSSRSTAGRPGRDRSRSGSTHRASTSRMSLRPWDDNPASTGAGQSWASISPAW